MQEIISFITGGATEFTPSVMVGLIVFCMITDSLFMMIGSILRGARK